LANLIYHMSIYDTEYIEYVKMDESDIVRHPAVKEVLKILQN